MGVNSTRNLGTALMGIGILLILSVGGYFAWNEVQAAQVRSELEQGSTAAAARATGVALSAGAETAAAGPIASAAVAAASHRVSEPLALQGVASSPTATKVPSKPTETPPPRPTTTPTAVRTALPTPALPVRLIIRDLKIDTKVVEMGWDVVQTKGGPVSQWAIPKTFAGHHVNSAGIGQADNLVISGHNNIYGRVFMPISQAWKNDGRVKVDAFTDRSHVLDGRELQLFDAAGNRLTYVITEFLRLKDTGVSQAQRERNARYILPTGDERVTIVTCWPPTNNTHRLIVIARPEK